MPRIPITDRTQDDEEKERFTSKDLTRGQLLFYIFEDFLRGMYLFGCVFLDVIVILPFLPVFNFSYFRTLYGFQYFGNLNLYLPYAIILTGFLEIVAIYYEGHFWIKFFGEDATERRYAIKSH